MRSADAGRRRGAEALKAVAAHARVPADPRARRRGFLQGLRRARRAPDPSAYEEIDFHSPLAMRITRTGRTWASRDERAVRGGGRGLGRGRRRRRRRARRARTLGAAAGGRRSPQGRRSSCAGRPGPPTSSGGRCDSRSGAAIPASARSSLIGGRCVGGSTTINTKVALRASQRELDKWHAASGLRNERGEPISRADLEPHYERVETLPRACGLRDRLGLKPCVKTAKRGFEAVGATLEPVTTYTDENCGAVRVVPAGLPDQLGQVDGEHLHPAHRDSGGAGVARRLVRRAGADRGQRRRARGDRRRVRRRRRGRATRVDADVVVARVRLAATPLLLLSAQRYRTRWSGARWGCIPRSSCSGCSTSRRTLTWSRRSRAIALTSPPTTPAASWSRP